MKSKYFTYILIAVIIYLLFQKKRSAYTENEDEEIIEGEGPETEDSNIDVNNNIDDIIDNYRPPSDPLPVDNTKNDSCTI